MEVWQAELATHPWNFDARWQLIDVAAAIGAEEYEKSLREALERFPTSVRRARPIRPHTLTRCPRRGVYGCG